MLTGLCVEERSSTMMLANLAVMIVLTLVRPAFGFQIPVPDANCPAFKAGVKWRDYISVENYAPRDSTLWKSFRRRIHKSKTGE